MVKVRLLRWWRLDGQGKGGQSQMVKAVNIIWSRWSRRAMPYGEGKLVKVKVKLIEVKW